MKSRQITDEEAHCYYSQFLASEILPNLKELAKMYKPKEVKKMEKRTVKQAPPSPAEVPIKVPGQPAPKAVKIPPLSRYNKGNDGGAKK